MTIPPLPPAPSRADPATFAERGDAFIAALQGWGLAANALAAEMAAMAAVPGTTANSTTNLTIGTGAQTLTVETGLSYIAGMELVIASAATPTDRMIGTVTAYDAGTGALDVTVTSATGIGTYADWKISLTIAVSFDGRTYTDLRLAGKVTETVAAMTGDTFDPSIAPVQYRELTGAVTFADGLSEGESFTLLLDAGGHGVIWPTMEWAFGAVPALSITSTSILVIFKANGTLYGIFAGAT